MNAGIFIFKTSGFDKVGGMNKLYNDYPMAIPTPLVNGSDCGYPKDEAFHLLRNPITSDLPWPGNVFGITILSVWYFCSDQVCLMFTNLLVVRWFTLGSTHQSGSVQND